MPTFSQTLKFERHVEIEAKNAADANAKLEKLIYRSEFDGDVECCYQQTFEDEMVEYQACDGNSGTYDEDDHFTPCSKCDGVGSVVKTD